MNSRADIITSSMEKNNTLVKQFGLFSFFKIDDSEIKIEHPKRKKEYPMENDEIFDVPDLYGLYYSSRTPFFMNKKIVNLNKILIDNDVFLLKLIMLSFLEEITVKYFSEKEGYTVLSSKNLILDEKEVDSLIFHLPYFRPKILEGTSFNLDAKLTASQFVLLKKILLSFPKDVNITYNSWNDKHKVTLSSNDPDDDYFDDGSRANSQFQETFTMVVKKDLSEHKDPRSVSNLQAEELQKNSIQSNYNLYASDDFLNDNSGAVNPDGTMNFECMSNLP